MKKIISIFSVVFIIVSCSKNDNVSPINPVVADSILLDKLLIVDTVANDTSFVTFQYDNAKRLVYSNMFDVLSFTYSYSGSDTVPVKAVEDHQGAQFVWTHFLEHDAQNRLIYDSSFDQSFLSFPTDPRIFTDRYIYHADGHTDSLIYHSEQTTGSFRRYQARDPQGNITYERKDDSNVNESYDITYDDHPNPLYKIHPVKSPYFYNNIYPAFFERYTPQKMNFSKIIKKKYNASGAVISTITIDYVITYKANGYPATIRTVANGFTDVSSKKKFIFIYRN